MRKSTIRRCAAFALAGALILAAGCREKAAPEEVEPADRQYSIGILQSSDSAAQKASYVGFMSQMARLGYMQGENLTVTLSYDIDNPSILNTWIGGVKPDLILAISEPAAQSAAAATRDIPIVLAAVVDPEKSSLVASNTKPGNNVTGTSDYLSIQKQINLFKTALPKVKKIGVLYDRNERNSVILAKAALDMLTSVGWSPESEGVDSASAMALAFDALSKKNVDAIYIVSGGILSSSMKDVTEYCKKYRLPSVVGDEGMVESGGLITAGVDYFSLGMETANMADKILKGASKPADMPIQYIEATRLVYNKSMAASIGVTFPEDILSSADRVF